MPSAVEAAIAAFRLSHQHEIVRCGSCLIPVTPRGYCAETVPDAVLRIPADGY